MSNAVGQDVPWNSRDRERSDVFDSETATYRALSVQGAALTVETLTRPSELDSLRGDYEALNAEAELPLPFSLYEWHRTWCDHFLSPADAIRDSLLVYVVRTVTGHCVGIVPMVHTRRRVGPFNAYSLNILGADQALTEIRMPLVSHGYQAAVAQIVQGRLALLRQCDWIQWTGVTTAFARGLAGPLGTKWQQPLPDYVLDLPDDWVVFRKGLKRNIRESLRHCYNSLRRDQHEFSVVVLRTPEEIQSGIDQFIRLHSMRAGLLGTVVHRNHFESAAAQAFLRDVCARLAHRDTTRIFQLVIAGQVVATRIGFVMDRSLYLYYSGFDPAWARYSVMTTTLAEIIKYAIGMRIQTVNLSPGNDVGKTRWGPRVVPIGQLVQVGRPLRSRIARSLYDYALRPGRGAGWLRSALGRAQRRWS